MVRSDYQFVCWRRNRGSVLIRLCAVSGCYVCFVSMGSDCAYVGFSVVCRISQAYTQHFRCAGPSLKAHFLCMIGLCRLVGTR